MSIAPAWIVLRLEDGSETYDTRIPVESFSTRHVTEAAAEALAWFIETYVRETVERGTEWDPAERAKPVDTQ